MLSNLSYSNLLVMNNYASATDNCRWIFNITISELIIINDISGHFIPNFDAEFVLIILTVDLSVNCRKQKIIIAVIVYRS